MTKLSRVLLALLLLMEGGIIAVRGSAIEETIQDSRIFIYGTTSGIAILLLVIYGLKIKVASSLEERREAKRGILYVILGLFLIIIGASLVELIYRVPPELPTPAIINARVWSLSNPAIPGDEQTHLKFYFKNNLTENLSQVELQVSALKYNWCDDDVSVYTFPKRKIIHPGNTELYSYDNFCENSTQFSIDVKSNQNWWFFCLNCSSNLEGECTTKEGNC